MIPLKINNEVILKCSNGKHNLIEIWRAAANYDSAAVVRWCENCGAVAVDLDYDGRTNAGYYRSITGPKLLYK